MKALERAQSWAGLFAHYASAVILAAVFGWLVGASSLISDDHMVVSIVAPTVAGMSVLGVATLAVLLSFVGGPVLRTGTGADRRWTEEDRMPDEPSHIHVPRRPKGEGA
ncbi:MAG TPA: hypothetical protein VJ578_03765 [Dehalococcoidia bacterium]|nr:hypothetical protein [Dehalococcoidia bacterium]